MHHSLEVLSLQKVTAQPCLHKVMERHRMKMAFPVDASTVDELDQSLPVFQAPLKPLQ